MIWSRSNTQFRVVFLQHSSECAQNAWYNRNKTKHKKLYTFYEIYYGFFTVTSMSWCKKDVT